MSSLAQEAAPEMEGYMSAALVADYIKENPSVVFEERSKLSQVSAAIDP
jgi:hypothetical protein